MDVTLLLDTSGSTSSVLDAFRAQADQIAALVRAEDRVRVTAFASAVRDVMPLGPRGPLVLAGPLPTGETALFDALVHTLYRQVEPGRLARHRGAPDRPGQGRLHRPGTARVRGRRAVRKITTAPPSPSAAKWLERADAHRIL